MQYNCHVAKFKKDDIGGIEKEQFRQFKNEENYKNWVDHNKTNLNIYHKYYDENWISTINKFQKKHEEIIGKGLRKDAVVFDSIVQSVPASWNYDSAKEYFELNELFLKNFLKKYGVDDDAFLSAVTHYDETSPHQTFVFMPISDGKFQNKKIMTKEFLRNLQKEGYENYLKFADRHPELEKLEPYEENHGRKHLELGQYKVKVMEEKIDQIKEDLHVLTETTNNIFDRVNLAADEIKRLEELPPIEDLNTHIQFFSKIEADKDPAVNLKIPYRVLYRIKDAFESIKTWFEARFDIISEIKPTKEEISIINNTKKSIYDHIAEAEKLMKENEKKEVYKSKNKEHSI